MGTFSRTLPTGLLAAGLVACSTVKDGTTAGYDLDFSKQRYTEQSLEVSGRNMKFCACEGIIYVGNPVDAKYEIISIYVPEAYYSGGSVGGFIAETASIFFPNQIGGYIPAEPGKPGFGRGGEASQTPNTALTALSGGYVVAPPGARGRTAANSKAPAATVDLKAAVHCLKFSDKAMPRDAGKVISNGTNTGGALPALLGAAGNSRDYEAHLKTLGATEGGDDILTVSAYCPITDLDHTDMAYEWQFNGVNDCQEMNISILGYNVKRELVPDTLTKEEISLSNQLKPLYPTYINNLKLRDAGGHALTPGRNGNGNFRDYVAGCLVKSAQSQLDTGKKLGNRNWLTVKNGRITAADFSKYAKTAGRQKIPPVFSGVDLSTGENQLFGNAQTDKRHFTEFSMRHSTAENVAVTGTETVRTMNPLNYTDASGVEIPQNWRIRVDTADRDTPLVVSAILATKLQNNGYAVDYFLPWDVSHNGDYGLEELLVWMKRVSTQE